MLVDARVLSYRISKVMKQKSISPLTRPSASRLKWAVFVVSILTAGLLIKGLRKEWTSSARERPLESATEWLNSGDSIAPDVPVDQVPDYTVKNFDSVSLKKGVRVWRVFAKTAYLYNSQNILHLKDVTARLYSSDHVPTLITGKEAKLLTQTDQIELFGNVVTTFPDGATIKSDYLRFYSEQRRIEIPSRYRVEGSSGPDQQFVSQGLIYLGAVDEVYLPSSVVFTITRKVNPTKTVVQSDRARIDRKRQVAHFFMARQPLEKAYVRITQPDFLMRSRLVDAFYGRSHSTAPRTSQYDEKFHFLVAHNDVYFQEGPPGETRIRYGTCGTAEFDSDRNVIFLTQFPQVYENEDTITGERIRVDRDSDMVEIEHSNAFNSGQNK